LTAYGRKNYNTGTISPDEGHRLLLIAVLRILFIALHTLFWSVPVLLLSSLDPYAERAARLIRFWAKGNLWACGVKVRVHGLERLDPRKAYLFMSNHQSQFDILALISVLDAFQLRWVAKRELRKVPVLGLCMQRTHQILVDRENRTQAVATIRRVKELLTAGISVLFFPEGTRSKDGNLLPFKPGGFAVAVETGVPVVPITINGSRAIMPSGDWKVRSGEIEIIVEEPIPLDPHISKKTAREELLVKVRQAIAAHHRPGTPLVPPVNPPLVVPSSTPEQPTS
jgi:1-acyl-sn-glycerol-3-phosphate acyltransferase